MSNEESVLDMFNAVKDICLEDPDRGLQILSNMTREAPETNNEYRPHVLYFIAYGSKALREDRASGGNLREETRTWQLQYLN